MKIAILVPSRERMNRRLTLLTSIITTVSDINNVNIYFGVDMDDPTRELIYKVSKAIPCVKIVDIDNKGEFIGLGKMWNICTDNSTEQIISMIGDDMVFRTPNWDLEIIKEFTENCPEDKIKAIHCNDDCHGAKLAVNLFCHRKYAEILGRFMREEFKINWVDQWMHQVFSAFGRLSYRGDIMIEHRHWVLGKDKRDKTAERMAVADVNKISDKLWFDLVDERIKDVWKLEDYLKMKADWSTVDVEQATLIYQR
jgi:hypothetical protein